MGSLRDIRVIPRSRNWVPSVTPPTALFVRSRHATTPEAAAWETELDGGLGNLVRGRILSLNAILTEKREPI